MAAGAHRGRRLPGHAGDFETSMMLALRPDLPHGPLPHRDLPGDTDPVARVPPWRTEMHGSWQKIDGYTDSPDQALADTGQRCFDIITADVARGFVSFYNA